MFLHSNLKFLRTYIRLTQSDFGKLFKKSRSNIDSYERGNAKPDEDFQKGVADHFSISLETLLYKDIQKNPALLLDNSGIQKEGELLKAKDEMIRDLRSQIRFLQQQNESLLNRMSLKK